VYLLRIGLSRSLDKVEEGFTINGTKLNNIRNADDTIMFADNLQGLALTERVGNEQKAKLPAR